MDRQTRQDTESQVQSQQTRQREVQLVVEQRTVWEDPLLDAGLHRTLSGQSMRGIQVTALKCVESVPEQIFHHVRQPFHAGHTRELSVQVFQPSLLYFQPKTSG